MALRTASIIVILGMSVPRFLALAALNSAGVIPALLADAAGAVSRWCLLISIAAVGVKTSLRKMLEVGGGAIALLVIETVFLGTWILVGLHFLR